MSVGLDSDAGGERYCPTCERTYHSGERCPADNTRLVKLTQSIDVLIGRELDGRYTIVEQLGQGGMGTVYRGTQHSVGREVAIKVVSPQLVREPVVIKRFLREAKLASRLSHPNAVSILDFGQTEDGLFYLVMELVTGRTLEAVIETDGKLTPARVVRIGAQICDALEGAHQLKIVHRDLKPANVMLLASGRDLVKVLDFGLAKSLSPDASTATMTNAGALIGTPAFMPPELVTGGEADGRSDLYSLGCILYEAASGAQPFVAGSIHELIAMHASEPIKPLVGMPVALAAAIERLLEKDPRERFPTAAQTRDALEAALGGDVIETAEPTLIAGSATVLGWTGDTSKSGRISKVMVSAPPPSDRMRAKSEPPIDDSELMASAPAIYAPTGIKPIPPPREVAKTETIAARGVATRRSPVWWIIVAIVVIAIGGAIAFVITSRTNAPAPAAPP